MNSIRSLQGNVTREEALQTLRGGLFRRAMLGRLRSVALVYVPFRLYEIDINNGGRCTRRLVALDAVHGELDLYEFDSVPKMVSVHTRNHPDAVMAQDEACCRVIEKVRRLLFLNGSFGLRDLKIEAREAPVRVHVPYWVGFYGSAREIRVEVIDAVRRRPEGAKVRNLVREWLAE